MSSMTRFDLPAALKAAKSGDVITLPPGDYGDVRLSAKFDAPVTLRAQGATVRSLLLKECAGLLIDGLTIDWTPTPLTVDSENAVSVRGCERITFSNLKVVGHPAVAGIDPATPSTAPRSTSMVIGQPTGRGVYIESSKAIVLTGCDISGFHRGVVIYKGFDLGLYGNDVHDLRGSGVVASGVDRLMIRRNRLCASRPWSYGGNGDHADFIAIQTVRDQANPSLDISILDNLLDQGDGAPIMGMLIGGDPGFESLTIRNNLILGGHTQALLLGKVLSGDVSGNVARRIGGELKTSPGLLTRDLPAKFAISDNRLGSIVVGPGTKNIPVADGNRYDQSEASAGELAELRAAWAASYRPAPVVEEPQTPEPEVIEITLKPGQRLVVTGAA